MRKNDRLMNYYILCFEQNKGKNESILYFDLKDKHFFCEMIRNQGNYK